MDKEDLKIALEVKKAEFMKELEDEGLLKSETLKKFAGIVYDDAFLAGAGYVVDTIHTVIPRGASNA